MSGDASFNPFPGPQPYRAADRARFFGREDTSRKLLNRILAHPCVTLFGPSGSGKSSLMQASVIPLLNEQHGFRAVRVDGWLAGETPLERLVQAMFVELELGEPPEELSPRELLDEALRLAERRSERPILIYLDQLEQPLLPDRPPEQLRELLDGLEALARAPVRGLQLVLSLREDYLGRFQDRARGNRALQDPGFRLGPLTVKEMAQVACRLAGTGALPQAWRHDELRALMLQMRTAGQSATDEAEVQAAFAQIVCRALWEERRTGAAVAGLVEAEPILHRYLDAALDSLGPLRSAAVTLLEEHLVARDGSRTLLTQRQAEDALPAGAAAPVLDSLERAAVLHAEQHQGGRYFELGHDWLAKKVLELKRERLREEKKAQKREEEARSRQRERAARRKLVGFTAAATGVALLLLGLFLWGLKARLLAEASEEMAFNQSLMAGAREQMQRGQPAMAAKLLAEVKNRKTDTPQGWDALALEALDSNSLEVTLRGLSGESFNAAAFNKDDGQRIVTASDDGTVTVWWADRRGEPRVLAGHTGAVTAAEFSPDGQRIVTASKDGTVWVWLTEDEGPPLLFRLDGPVRSAGFSPDGRRIVTVGRDGIARVWRADNPAGPSLATLDLGRHKRINFAAFSPDRNDPRIVTTSWDGTAQVWQADGRARPLELKKEHTGPVTSAAFSPDGKRVVTASQDGTARVWWADGRGKSLELKGHNGPVTSAVFSLDGKRIVTTSWDGSARVWRAEASGLPVMLKELKGHMGPVQTAAFSPDPSVPRIVTASQDGTARVWRDESMWQPFVLIAMKHESPVAAAASSPDGHRIVTASQDGVARVWPAQGAKPPIPLRGHTRALTSAAFSQDGERIVTTSWDKTARVWERRSGVWESHVLLHETPVQSAAFSPDGQRVVTGSQDGVARVWQADTSGRFSVRWRFPAHKGPVTSVAFSKDGRFIVTASRDKTARVWHADGSGLPRTLEGHLGPVTSAAFSPLDGQRVVTTSQDGKTRVWSLEAGDSKLLFVLPSEGTANQGPVQSAAFSPSGQSIVTTSWDGTARVWRADGSGQPRVLKGHEGPVRSAAFLGDDRHVVTASWDRSARIWLLPELETLTTPMLLQQLRERNNDCLPPALRGTYLKEDEEESRKGYEQCERDHHRVPSQAVALRSDSRAAGSPRRM